MDPLSLLLRLCLSLAVILTEVFSFFISVRMLAAVFKSRWLQTVNDAGQPLVDSALGALDRGLPASIALRETPRLCVALLILALVRLSLTSIW